MEPESHEPNATSFDQAEMLAEVLNSVNPGLGDHTLMAAKQMAETIESLVLDTDTQMVALVLETTDTDEWMRRMHAAHVMLAVQLCEGFNKLAGSLLHTLSRRGIEELGQDHPFLNLSKGVSMIVANTPAMAALVLMGMHHMDQVGRLTTFDESEDMVQGVTKEDG